MASLLYGSGLRLRECCTLRVKDLVFDYLQITIRDGKGGKDRRTVLPSKLIDFQTIPRRLSTSHRWFHPFAD
jgi:integrase